MPILSSRLRLLSPPAKGLCLAAALLVAGDPAVFAGSCPIGFSEKLQKSDWDPDGSTAFIWEVDWSPIALGPGDQLIVDFAIIPFPSDGGPYSNTRTFLDLFSKQGIGWRINFENGFVKDCYSSGPCPGALPYHPNEWNTVHAVIDIATQTYTVTVNGAPSGPIPLQNPVGSAFTEVDGLLVWGDYNGHGYDYAWIDEIAVTRSSPSHSSVVYQATFDDTPGYLAGWGSMTTETPPPAHQPASCEATGLRLTVTTDKKSLAWSAPEVPTRYDVVSRRLSGPFDGDFAAFNPRTCYTAETSYSIVPQGIPPAGFADLWVIRPRPNDVPGSWNEGGNQVQPRNMPSGFCP